MPASNGNGHQTDAITRTGGSVRAILKWMAMPVVLLWMLVCLILQRMWPMLLGAIAGAIASLPVFFIYAIATGGDGLFTSHLESGHWLHGWPFYVTAGVGALFGLLFPGVVHQMRARIGSRDHSGSDSASFGQRTPPKQRETGSLAGAVLWYLAYKQAKGEGSEGAEKVKRAATGHGLKDWFDKDAK